MKIEVHLEELFDGLEIHPVYESDKDESTGKTWCEPCAREDAHFWSVYGHLKEGGVDCLEDFETEAEANAFVEKLLDAYPISMVLNSHEGTHKRTLKSKGHVFGCNVLPLRSDPPLQAGP